MLKTSLAAAVIVLASWSVALGQSAGDGIGIAAAPEEGFYACTGDNADRVLACARQKCRAAVPAGTPCYRVRWCFPAGWSGAMTYLANRELTETTFTCGAPSEAAVTAKLSAHCAADPAATECRLAAIWNPAGDESERTDHLGKNTAD